ncbi:MAG: 3-oxoacyl-[acyl-carrier-protein] reductase FabG, partial [Pseudomonadota bacterium]
MDLQLNNKTALVTGASTGIGKSIAFALAKEGVQLAISARRVDLLNEVANDIVKNGGKTYVAGVSYWTGLYCADYNLYTRIDPFLPFLDRAARKTGKEPVKPALDCVAPNSDGTYTAYFGYDNKNGVNMSVPYGRR